MKSELHETLSVVQAIMLAGTASAAELCEAHGCSVATLKRRLDDARHLGAHVESVKLGAGWQYHVANGPVIAERLGTWLALERERSLVGEVPRHW